MMINSYPKHDSRNNGEEGVTAKLTNVPSVTVARRDFQDTS